MDQQNFEETWFTCWHFSRLKFKIIWSVTHLVSLKLMIVSVSDLILSTEKCIICLTNIFTDKQFRILTPQIVFLLPHWQVKQWRAHCCQSSQYNSNKDLYKILETSVSNARLSVWKMAILLLSTTISDWTLSYESEMYFTNWNIFASQLPYLDPQIVHDSQLPNIMFTWQLDTETTSPFLRNFRRHLTY